MYKYLISIFLIVGFVVSVSHVHFEADFNHDKKTDCLLCLNPIINSTSSIKTIQSPLYKYEFKILTDNQLNSFTYSNIYCSRAPPKV